ncbi:MAG: serine/threonine protein kinase, partial [Bradymonadaceae bacterium]
QAEATDPGVVKGKFGYLSPEAAQGEEIDERTDIFAVGILMWEMLTGKRLFLGESDYETLQLVREADVPPVSAGGRRIPDRLQQLLDGALAKHPDNRFGSARRLAEGLAQFLFARGDAVTSFDLAPYVKTVLGERTPVEDESLGPADMAVQREINQFVSIDDLEDMDLKLARAEPIGGESGSSPPPPEDGDFEDPRAWSDIGIDEEGGGSLDNEPIPEEVDQSGDEWKEQGLEDVARATQSMNAIDGDDEPDRGDEDPAAQRDGQPGASGGQPDRQARQQPRQKQASPDRQAGRGGRQGHPGRGSQGPSGRGGERASQPPPPTAPSEPDETDDGGSTTRLLLGLIGVLLFMLLAGLVYLFTIA